MPERPRQHRLANDSRIHFERLLPEAWVFREEHPDYGVDGEVEVFDGEGSATGLRFHVQLKATDAMDLDEEPSVRLSRETFEYYESLDLPVLIVFFHSPSEKTFVRWVHEFDSYYGGAGERTIAFPFPLRSEWVDSTADKIVDDLQAQRILKSASLPLPIQMTVEVTEDEFHGLAAAQLVARIRVAAQDAWATIQVSQGTDQTRPRMVHTVISEDAVVVNLAGSHGATLQLNGEKPNLSSLQNDVLLLVAVALSRAGHLSPASGLALVVVEGSTLLRDQAFSAEVLRCILGARRTSELLELAERMEGDEDLRGFARTLEMSSILLPNNPHEEETVREFLRHKVELVEVQGSEGEQAMAHYNLANNLRQVSMFDAGRHYVQAARLDESYWLRGYFCRELAGVSFDLHRYSCAKRLYKMALDTGEPGQEEVVALLADSAMHAGDFEEAVEGFEKYADSVDHPNHEWILKSWVLKGLMSLLGIQKQNRDPLVARRLLDQREDHDEEPLRSILAMDALCGRAWDRLGTLYHRDGRVTDAIGAYVLSGLLDRWNLEVWCDAIGISLTTEDLRHMFPEILSTAYEIGGDRLFEALASFAGHQPEGFPAKEFVNTIGDCLGKMSRRATSGPRVMRMIGPENKIFQLDLSPVSGVDGE